MTIYEKLRGMDEKELAQALCDCFISCADCPFFHKSYCFETWFQMEADKDDDDDPETQ